MMIKQFFFLTCTVIQTNSNLKEIYLIDLNNAWLSTKHKTYVYSNSYIKIKRGNIFDFIVLCNTLYVFMYNCYLLWCILCMELFTHTFASVFICYYIMIMCMHFVFICFNGVTVPKAIKWNWKWNWNCRLSQIDLSSISSVLE